MKTRIKKWLGIDGLVRRADMQHDIYNRLQKDVRVLESAIGEKTLSFHRRSLHRKEAMRYDEIERARKLDRKRKLRSKG